MASPWSDLFLKQNNPYVTIFGDYSILIARHGLCYLCEKMSYVLGHILLLPKWVLLTGTGCPGR